MKNITHLFCLSLFLSGCTGGGKAPDMAALPESAYRVDISAVENRTVTPEITSFGTVSFKRKTDISCGVDGIIRKIEVEEGESVRKGDILARLENIQLKIRQEQALSEITSTEAALSLAHVRYQEGRLAVEGRLISIEKMNLQAELKQAELEEFEKTLSHKEELFAADGISEEEMRSLRLSHLSLKTEIRTLGKDIALSMIGFRDRDIVNAGFRVPLDPDAKRNLLITLNTRTLKAETEVAAARLATAGAELSSIDLLLSELTIKAENDSILGVRYLEEGERVTAGTKLFTTFQSREVFVSFPVPERETLRLALGQRVEASVPALGNITIQGILEIISPTIDPQSGNFTIKALLTNPDNALKPGMFAHIKVITGAPEKRTVIPKNAFIRKSEKEGEVFVLSGDRVFLRRVTSGEEIDSTLEILEGLDPGERVVTDPPPFLKDGTHVDVSS